MKEYFYGWYMKCQSDKDTFCVIPAVHKGRKGKTCSIQVIVNDSVFNVDFAGDKFIQSGDRIIIGDNIFCRPGIKLALKEAGLSLNGMLRFKNPAPLCYDIMGPFKAVPFMECRHMVFSMQTEVYGKLCINGKEYVFNNAKGYWEGDKGCSFPKRYIWSHCFFDEGSIMFSVADIPMFGINFTGVIGVIRWRNKEYRLATYLGAKAVVICNGRIRIVQGNLELDVILCKKGGKPLNAPLNGCMTRVIHENTHGSAFFGFKKKGKTLFAFETDRAAFEYEF